MSTQLLAVDVATREHRHVVELYGSDDSLVDSVTSYLEQGLRQGEPALVIATDLHQKRMRDALRARDLPVDELEARGQLSLHDAAPFVELFGNDRAKFRRNLETILRTVIAAGPRRHVRAFGEMVDVLWGRGLKREALELEQMWSELATQYDFELVCGYSLAHFGSEAEAIQVCELHGATTVRGGVPPEVSVLAREVVRRKALEDELREALDAERRRADRSIALQRATARLAATVSVQAVADELVGTMRALFDSAVVFVYLCDEEGALHLRGAHDAGDLAERFPTLSLDEPLPLAMAAKQREPVFLASYEDLVARFPRIASSPISPLKLQSMAAVPLVQGDKLVGAFAVTFPNGRTFDVFERDWLVNIAGQAALAIERVRSVIGEQQARAEAEALVAVARALNDVSFDLETIVQRVTDAVTSLTGAEFGAFFYTVPSQGGTMTLYTLSGAPKSSFEKFGLPGKTKLFGPTFDGQTVRIGDVLVDPRFTGMPPGHLPVRSYLAVPVAAGNGEVLGGLFLGHAEPHRFTATHERVVQGMAASAAVAVDNAKRMSALRATSESQRVLIEELSETIRMNDLFTGMLAHDLRNPLGAVTTAAQLLQIRIQQGLPPDARPADRILAAGRRMARMIDQLLDFTRVRLGSGIPLEPKPGDLKAILTQVIDELVQGNPSRRVSLSVEGDTLGTWDDDRLGQAFSNLIANAAQHGDPAHGVTVRAIATAPDQVEVHIHNAGAIPAELLPRLFAPMVGGQRRRDGSRGLGLGLFITNEVARRHGGSISVQSSVDSGTTFVVALPRHVESVVVREPPAPRPNVRARERLLVETIQDYAIYMLDLEGRIQSWNRGAELAKGYRAEEVLGKHIELFYTPEDRQRRLSQHLLQRALAEGHVEDEGWRVRKDGSKFWALVVITALKDEQGLPIGFAKVTRDLTERKKADEERVRLAQAQEGIRLRDEFLSIVSHELRTPLTGLQLQIDLLSEQIGSSDPRIAEKLRRASVSTERLTQLIESLLDVSRIATGRFVLSLEELDLTRLVQDTVETFRPAASRTGTPMLVDAIEPVIGHWDRVRMTQAITNLLSNALKYGVGRPIDIRLRATAEKVLLEVRDHGPGIAPEDRERVFERFERASSVRHFGGLGIGLYVVREIVVAHGGRVTIGNGTDSGAILHVELPRGGPGNEHGSAR